ncbi:uncharacterized protein LOC112574264 [Pomacea canaliculata]|uniref:uncharacterized protein LOC112574264 n=1 Tax=Pomacea canaliculata TaxID=400727 RepID=UPI000D72A481|nr:uncharacterized protein LOC112574264 [Pomacea canaliculata]XP_025110994.1 uncharacterized protein LOC112574264 [Pomacea canaliculata]
MALITKLIFLDLWIILSAQIAKGPSSNWEKPKVFINYKKSCFGNESSEDSYDSSVDGFFPVGCTVQVKCQYYDCTAKRNNSFIYIQLNNAELNRSVSLLARSECDVEALITDVTKDFNSARVECKDLLNPFETREGHLQLDIHHSNLRTLL